MKKYLVLFLGVLAALAYMFRGAPADNRDWMDRAVEREFAHFEKEGISKELLETSWANCRRKKEFHRYQVIDSKVYGPESRIKNLLEVLVQKYPVPDVDFIYFYEDRLKKTFFKRSKHVHSAPIFVSAKEKSLDSTILFSDWVYDVKEEQRGWNFLIKMVNEGLVSWSEKREKLFWRGTPWDGKHFDMYTFDNWKTIPRGRLVYDSRKYPELIDAVFSEYPLQCRQDLERCEKEMGALNFTPWSEVLRYKYQMIMDGVTCSFPATQWKLLSGCVPFKQESDDIQFFYGELVPWKHYIPVRKDLSDLIQKVNWAKKHDGEAREIAENAREFALTHLMPEHILLYSYKVLVKYASLQRFQPVLL